MFGMVMMRSTTSIARDAAFGKWLNTDILTDTEAYYEAYNEYRAARTVNEIVTYATIGYAVVVIVALVVYLILLYKKMPYYTEMRMFYIMFHKC